jgi:heme-degrading monooxygenase HmoA
MIVEHVWVKVIAGQEEQYEAAVREALPIIESADQCFGAELRRQVEDPTRYLLLVQWASVEAHMAFRETDLFPRWRALTWPFYEGTPEVTHFSPALPR